MNPKEQIIHELVEKGVFDAIGDGISIQNTNYKILYQNKIHKDLVGSHVGEYCYNSYEKRKDRCKGCPLAETFKDGEIHRRERSAPTDKGTIYVEITTSPIKVPSGEIIAGIEVVRDITERKNLEEKLKISEEKYRLIFSTEQDAIIIVDAESRRIVDANNSALKLYGYNKEEILELTGPGLSAEPEKTDTAISEIAKATDKRFHFHIRNHKKKDGTVFPVEISSGSFILQGRKMISAVIRDVSEHKRMVKELGESNIALKVLLKQRENDKEVLEENIVSNIKNLILPYILKMKKSQPMSEALSYLNIVESNLKEIVSPFSVQLTSKYLGFTAKEIQIANLVKEGHQDKGIAEILNISLDTVKSHRQNIRKKLGIYGKRTNLRTHLLSSSFIVE
jgi:PAS domain S-box-containing protein